MQGEDLKVIYSGPDLQTPSDMGRGGALDFILGGGHREKSMWVGAGPQG